MPGSRMRRVGGRPSFTVSSDGRYLQDAAGVPFFLNGDTAWSLISQLTDGDATTYLADRQAKGYNAIIVEMIEKNGVNSGILSDIYGNAPFTGAAFSTPNSAFFGHIDTKFTDAGSKNLVVLAWPFYLGFNANEGWRDEVTAASAAVMYDYGYYIGNRYKSFPKIMWALSGDTDADAISGMAAKCDAFVAGLKAAGDSHLMTAHNSRQGSGREAFAAATWLDFNSTYPDDTTGPAEAAANYTASPFLPSFLVEAYYENEHTMTALGLRKQAYWCILAGSYLGHFFGNSPIWSFDYWPVASHAWATELSSTGSVQLALVGRLFKSRRFHLLVPDAAHTVTTLGYSSGANLVTTSRCSDGSSVVAYLPTGSTVTITVDLTKVAGATARAWWWNPRTAVATVIADYATSGTQTFTPSDTNDWVLVLDNLAVFTTAPGQ